MSSQNEWHPHDYVMHFYRISGLLPMKKKENVLINYGSDNISLGSSSAHCCGAAGDIIDYTKS